jgi:hypothetical protein
MKNLRHEDTWGNKLVDIPRSQLFVTMRMWTFDRPPLPSVDASLEIDPEAVATVDWIMLTFVRRLESCILLWRNLLAVTDLAFEDAMLINQGEVPPKPVSSFDFSTVGAVLTSQRWLSFPTCG